MVLASALTPSPSGIRLIAISPVAIASRVPNWKYTNALIPVDPTCLMFATLAMPATIVRNTIGPISIRIAVTNVVPTGSIAVPNPGHSQPTSTPRMIATITQKYSCRYHFVFLTGPVSLSAARESAIVSHLIVGNTRSSAATAKSLWTRSVLCTKDPQDTARVDGSADVPRIVIPGDAGGGSSVEPPPTRSGC